MPLHPVIGSILLTLPLAFGAIHAQTAKYPDFWNDSALSAKIDQSIERNRKSDAVIRMTDANGRPVSGVRVSVEQIDSSFHFGANIFMLGGYPTPELNRRYEEAFCKLFNGATVPFYWSDLEPKQGEPRFAADSPAIARRPPPDAVVAFCKEHGLKMHGHPLIWNLRVMVPMWLPADTSKSGPLIEERIRQIAERYGNRIHRWDVVNEVVAGGSQLIPGIPPNYDRLAFAWAQRYFPAGTSLYINETTSCWDYGRRPYIELLRRLLVTARTFRGSASSFTSWTRTDY